MRRTPAIPQSAADGPRSGKARVGRPSKVTHGVSHRGHLPRWGDQDPSHRIPTFLEAMLFEGDDSATRPARLDS
nr:hypothetical protein [Panacagrimonas sp.]